MYHYYMLLVVIGMMIIEPL